MRFYRLLLFAYPASFRAEYGREMCAVFARRRRDASGPLGVAWLWLETLADTAVSALRVQLDVLGQDVAFTARSVRLSPAFALTTLLVTALGIGSVCHPGDCRLYLGAAGGGVWRTDDALANPPAWKSVSLGLFTNAIGSLWVDPKNNELWAANFMNHSATVYSLGASGDVAPLRMIRSGPLKEPSLGIGNPHPVAYDSKREQILVPN